MKQNLPSTELGYSISRENLPEVVQHFKPKTDFSYRKISNIDLDGINFEQSLFNGSILRQTSFENVNLSRCDFEGTQVDSATFLSTSFQFADIRSAVFSDTTFKNCSFEESYLNDCSFNNCQFTNCNFSGSLFSENEIVRTDFLDTSFRRSTNVRNTYRKCDFNKMVLGDCTFSLQVMDDCTFQETAINIDAIGLIYGLTLDAVSQLEFLFLGNSEKKPSVDDLIAGLHKKYLERNWFVGLAVLRLNFGITSPITAIRELIFSVVQLARNGVLVKKDDLSFFNTILKELYAKENLPFFSVQEILSVSGSFIEEQSNLKHAHYQKMEPMFLGFQNEVYLLSQEMLEKLEVVSVDITTTNDPVILKIKYHTEPKTSVVELLNQLLEESEFEGSKAKLIRTSEGSFIEFILTSIKAVFLFQVFLFGLIGTVTLLTDLRARVEVLARKNLPKTYRNDALSPKQRMPEHLRGTIRLVMGKLDGLINLVDYGGVNAENVVEVSIENETDSQTSTQGAEVVD